MPCVLAVADKYSVARFANKDFVFCKYIHNVIHDEQTLALDRRYDSKQKNKVIK